MEFEKLYMFNPFTIQNASSEKISETYINLQKALIENPETGFDISKNIELYANMNYLIGEMIARIQEEYDFKGVSNIRKKLNGAPRFSKEEIFEILDRVLNKKQTRQSIADEKAVDRTVIYRICNGKSYVNYYNEFMNASNR